MYVCVGVFVHEDSFSHVRLYEHRCGMVGLYVDLTVIVKIIRTEAGNSYFKMESTAQPVCAFVLGYVYLSVLVLVFMHSPCQI